MEKIQKAKQQEALDRAALSKKKLRKRSLVPVLFGVQMLFILKVIYDAYTTKRVTFEQAAALCVVPAVLTAYFQRITRLGKEGFFLKDNVITRLPILWMPLGTVSVFLIARLCLPGAVNALFSAHSPSIWIGLQTLRVTAFGSLVKWYRGVFPWSFAWFTALPDFLYGVCAMLMLMIGDSVYDPMTLVIFNIAGFIMINPIGVLILQFGMEPTKLYTSKVSHDLIFEYPMVLAPIIVVPIFLSFNLLHCQYLLSSL